MVQQTREYYLKFLKEFFTECEKVDAELKAQSEIVDDNNSALLSLRDQLTKKEERNQQFCIPLSTNVKKKGLFEKLIDA